ncbi:SsrA-binding protein SmpB [Pseudomonas luteola]
MSKAKAQSTNSLIAQNKKSRHDYFLEQFFEAGLCLEGWEVKSLRAGKAQLTDSYVIFKNGEAFLMGALITPLSTVSTHFIPDPIRTRKLLLNKNELNKLMIAVEQKGYTCVAVSLKWHKHLVKCDIALAKGKKDHDKRASEKDRDWAREKQRIALSS